MRDKKPAELHAFWISALLLASGIAGCSAEPIIDRIPTELGGEPANTPKRPQAPPPYPAVHDVPSPRQSPALSGEDQLKLEQELSQARRKQESLQDPTAKDRAAAANARAEDAMQKAKAAAKKKPPRPNPQ